MTIEKALSKLRSAQICHPNAVQHLIDEAIEALTALAQQAQGAQIASHWVRTHRVFHEYENSAKEDSDGYLTTTFSAGPKRPNGDGWEPLYTTPPPAQQAQGEPVYQLQLSSGHWIDQSENQYNYNKAHESNVVRILYTTPQPAQASQSVQGGGDAWISDVLLAVAELPDRTSPDDQPEMMLVTSEELRDILSAISLPPAQPAQAEQRITPEMWMELGKAQALLDRQKTQPAPQVPAPSPQPAVPVVSDEQIDKICYMATEIRFAKTDDAAQAVIDKIRAILALRPQAAIPEVDVHKDGDGDAHVCLSLGNGSFFDCAVSRSGSVSWAFKIGGHTAHKKEQVDWRPQAVPMTDDTARLDYLQESGSTVDLLTGIVGFTPRQFRIGGLHAAVNPDIRKAIDVARGITAKTERGA